MDEMSVFNPWKCGICPCSPSQIDMDEFVISHYPLEILGYYHYTPQKPLWMCPFSSNTPWKFEMFPFYPSEISMDGFNFMTSVWNFVIVLRNTPQGTKSIFIFKVKKMLCTENKYCDNNLKTRETQIAKTQRIEIVNRHVCWLHIHLFLCH